LKIIEPALKEIASRHKIKIVTIGADNRALRTVSFQNLPWVEESEAYTISNFDVGVMPLPDEPFERGKCGYKLIQYMACNVPVVASPVGVNTEIVEAGRNGFLASSTNQWVNALELLISTPQKARKMGREGRRKVEENYCLQITAPILARIIQSAVRQRSDK
jgi:glycosyltransferase involved in cell wall biosynthesis